MRDRVAYQCFQLRLTLEYVDGDFHGDHRRVVQRHLLDFDEVFDGGHDQFCRCLLCSLADLLPVTLWIWVVVR